MGRSESFLFPSLRSFRRKREKNKDSLDPQNGLFATQQKTSQKRKREEKKKQKRPSPLKALCEKKKKEKNEKERGEFENKNEKNQ
jgi:hypothetical protein